MKPISQIITCSKSSAGLSMQTISNHLQPRTHKRGTVLDETPVEMMTGERLREQSFYRQLIVCSFSQSESKSIRVGNVTDIRKSASDMLHMFTVISNNAKARKRMTIATTL